MSMSASTTVPGVPQGTALAYDASRVGTDARDWLVLLKPRVISLVVFTGAAGLYMAPGPINPLVGAVIILCVCMASGAAGAINMWYDRDIAVSYTHLTLPTILLV